METVNELAQKYVSLVEREIELKTELQRLIDERNETFGKWVRAKEASLPTVAEQIEFHKGRKGDR